MKNRRMMQGRYGALAMASVGLVLVALAGAVACNSSDNGGDAPADGALGEPDRHLVVTFSGGGYQASSGGAAWMMGLMERTKSYSLANVTAKVKAIGSNSGGSWFLTLAAYSETFLKELETSGEYKLYAAPNGTPNAGYLTKVMSYLDPTNKPEPCSSYPQGAARDACKLVYPIVKDFAGEGYANLFFSDAGQWQGSVEIAVFGKDQSWGQYYTDVSAFNLGSSRHNWSADIDLVFASTLLTQDPSLTYTTVTGIPDDYYQGVQVLEGTQSNVHGGALIPLGVPVMLGTSNKPYDVLPGGTMTLTYGTWSRKSALDPYEFHAGANSEDVQHMANSPDLISAVRSLPVASAAALSSAAGGAFIDIPIFKKLIPGLSGKDMTTLLNGFAPAYQMQDPGSGTPMMEFHSNVHKDFGKSSVSATTDALANGQVVRMADGGFVDNDAVAQMLRYLQDNSSSGGFVPNNFSIVVFDNYPVADTHWLPGATVFPTGRDFATLFGFNGCSKSSCAMQTGDTRDENLNGLKATGMSARVFKCSDYFSNGCAGGPPIDNSYWTGDKIDCRFNGEKEQQPPLRYSRYEVTVDPTAPGIKLFGLKVSPVGSTTGTLHVFSMLGKGAAAVPNNADQLNCHQTMISSIVNAVVDRGMNCDVAQKNSSTNDCTLGDYLENAMGL